MLTLIEIKALTAEGGRMPSYLQVCVDYVRGLATAAMHR